MLDDHTYGGGGPNTGPGKHCHTSVLDFSFLYELLVGETVGESIEGLSIRQLSEVQGIPDLTIFVQFPFRNLAGSKGAVLDSGLLRGEGRSACGKGGEKGDGQLNHGEQSRS